MRQHNQAQTACNTSAALKSMNQIKAQMFKEYQEPRLTKLERLQLLKRKTKGRFNDLRIESNQSQ